MHAVEAMYSLPQVLTAGHHLYFRKDFQMLLAHKKGEIYFPHCALGHI